MHFRPILGKADDEISKYLYEKEHLLVILWSLDKKDEEISSGLWDGEEGGGRGEAWRHHTMPRRLPVDSGILT